MIAGGYGNSQTVWIDPDLAIGYGYSLDGTNRFLTYQIPEALPQGDDSFEIHHNGITYDLAAGEVFDFTTIDPQGVDSFLLYNSRGIDETELIDVDGQSHPPFVYGATFLQPGLAQVTTFALTQVPEPTSLLLLLLSTSLMASRRDDEPLLMPRRWCVLNVSGGSIRKIFTLSLEGWPISCGTDHIGRLCRKLSFFVH